MPTRDSSPCCVRPVARRYSRKTAAQSARAHAARSLTSVHGARPPMAEIYARAPEGCMTVTARHSDDGRVHTESGRRGSNSRDDVEGVPGRRRVPQTAGGLQAHGSDGRPRAPQGRRPRLPSVRLPPLQGEGDVMTEYCCFCQKPITGERVTLSMESMSGAKPDQHAHPGCGPRTRSISHSAPRQPRR